MTISNLIPLLRNGLLRNSGGISGRSGGVVGGGIVGGIVRKQQHTIRMTNRSYSMSSFLLNDSTTSNSNSSNTNNNTNMDYFPSDDYFPISDSHDDTTSTSANDNNDNNTFPFTNSTSSTSTSTTTPTINAIPRKGRPWNDPYELTNDDIENANATQKYRTLDDLPDWNKDMISRTSLERLKLFCGDDDNITTTTTNDDDDITNIANKNTNTNIPTLTQILQLKLPTSHPKHPALSDTSSSPFSFSSFGK